jgi:hypothetical protein
MDSEAEPDAGQATVPATMNPDTPPPEGAAAQVASVDAEAAAGGWVWDED